MSARKTADRIRLLKVESIRRTNNGLWMDILRIALDAAPKRTHALLRGINRNDAAVTRLLKKVAKKA